MSDFTYEENCTNALEYLEWDNLWFENAPEKNADRVLVIGDSISCGYRRIITELAGGRYFVDGIGTSKAVDNPSFIPLIEYFTSQITNIKVILINNGLHGAHLSVDDYEKNLSGLVEYLKNKYTYSKLVMVTTTPTRNAQNLNEYGNNYERILDLNRRALKIADKYGAAVCDLFSVIKNNPEYYVNDGVHLNGDGYTALAKECSRIISELI